jgi:peroxiredoxin
MPFNFSFRRVAAGFLTAVVLLSSALIIARSTALSNMHASEAPASTADVHVPETTANADPLDAPDFTLATLDGQDFRLSDKSGKVIVLNFWATWCPPCREEIPEFIEMQNEFRGDDILFVGVSLDQAGEAPVRNFAREMQINYPIMIDDGSASAAYGPIATLPTTFLIGRDGQLEGYAYGMVTREMLEPLLRRLVAGESLISGGRR